MAKEAFYFSHDFGARNDPKLQKVLMKLGQEGKGVFWDLIEMLYEEGGKLLISECESYAFALRTNENCIVSLINDFGLFIKNETHFWSESVNGRLNKRNEKSEKARDNARQRWEKDANANKINTNASNDNANALRKKSKSNAIKKSKVKEKKENDTNLFPIEEQSVDTSDGIHTACMAIYNEFIKSKTGVSAKINGKEGSAMKTIIEYLKKEIFNQDDFKVGIPNAFQYIFTHYDKWDKFHQSQIKLTQIDSNLINILNSIRNGKSINSTTTKGQSPFRKS